MYLVHSGGCFCNSEFNDFAKGETVITDDVFEIIHTKTNEDMNLFQFIQFGEIQISPIAAHLLTLHKSQGGLSDWGSCGICLCFCSWSDSCWILPRGISVSVAVIYPCLFVVWPCTNPHINCCFPFPIHVMELIISSYSWGLFTICSTTLKGTRNAGYYFPSHHCLLSFGVWWCISTGGIGLLGKT